MIFEEEEEEEEEEKDPMIKEYNDMREYILKKSEKIGGKFFAKAKVWLNTEESENFDNLQDMKKKIEEIYKKHNLG